jgi:hypothetical protein
VVSGATIVKFLSLWQPHPSRLQFLAKEVLMSATCGMSPDSQNQLHVACQSVLTRYSVVRGWARMPGIPGFTGQRNKGSAAELAPRPSPRRKIIQTPLQADGELAD